MLLQSEEKIISDKKNLKYLLNWPCGPHSLLVCTIVQYWRMLNGVGEFISIVH